MAGSTIVITYDGTDISAFCQFADCSFEAQMAAIPGVFAVLVRDMDQTLDFATGKELTLDIDGTRMFGGFVTQITKQYAFPADDTTIGVANVDSRQWLLSGVDYNILLDKLILRNTSDYTHQIPKVAGSTTDGAVVRGYFDNYFDLPAGFDFSDTGFILDNHTFTDGYNWLTQGSTMRQVLEDLGRYGSVFWIDADKQLNFIPVQDTAASWGFSDVPNNDPIGVGTPTRGFREGEFIEDAAAVVNDAIVWGGSEWAIGGDVVYDRRTNSTSVTDHGRWQVAEVRVGQANYKIQSEVTARAKVIVDGNESGTFAEGSQGLVNPEKQFRCTWFSTGVPIDGSAVHLRPSQVVPIELWVFSQDGGTTPFLVDLPLRQVRVTFPTLDAGGDAYAQFEGFFGVLMADPYWLWSFLREGQTQIERPGVISAADNSSVDPPYGAQYQDVPYPVPDGSTSVFTIPGDPNGPGVTFGYIAGTSEMFKSGLLQIPDVDYTESDPANGEYTFMVDPLITDTLWVRTTLTGNS